MKEVLIIDEPPLFREFLKNKLSTEGVNVEFATGSRDAFTKIVNLFPDLIIIDTLNDYDALTDLLKQKKENPNAKTIPIILTGPVLTKDQVQELPYYNITKYFNKPIKFDIFFESIGRILKIPLSIDTTQCIMDVHLNDNIIFIEIAQGLNREKLALLKYKISELLDFNKLTSPKVILMLTNLTLSFIDGANLELLLDNVIADERILKRNVKILSLDNFTKELVDGHVQYKGIEVTQNLAAVLASLIQGDSSDITEVISDKILTSTDDVDEGSIQMKFYSENGLPDNDTSENSSKGPKKTLIAIVDDEAVTRTLLLNTFKQINADCEVFETGTDFLRAINTKRYDLVVLDIYMPGISGFDILKRLKLQKNSSPVLVYSQATQRETVIQALTMGAKSYLAKPLKPNEIIKKAVEIMNSKI
ncbi:MAG: response regulator receiver protein [Treponema sp. CETP13]|nr:MAG: response regulator receiver protein [Treponema sp. CETP13]